jgi:leucine dehydrogenase
MSLGSALDRSELTTLRLVRDRGALVCTLSREWSPEWDFSGYGREFVVDQLACREPRLLGDAAARALLCDQGAEEELTALSEGMRRGRHEAVVMRRHRLLDLEVCHFIHSSALGRRNGMHALRAGGMRRVEAEASEREQLADGLNLSRAMSFKCAAAGVPFGGSKSTLRGSPFPPSDRARVGFVAWAIDRGRLMTGPDVGLDGALLDALGALTPHALCGPSGPLGSTGGPTAAGILDALAAASEHRFGARSLAGRRVAVQGLGAVGLELSMELARQGAEVLAADPDEERVALARERVSGLTVLEPSEILRTECDVLSPCALGGVLDERCIAELPCKMIYGAANNQLAGRSTEEELRLADLLAARGVLFQPDWTYTMGGILTGWEVYQRRELASFASVRAAIRRAAGDGTRDLLREAARSGETPSAVAHRWYSPLVHNERGLR